jgi:hypothetical protein
MSAVEWGRRFQELSAEAATMYARGLRRYDELLQRVAAGELQPEDVQARFRQYLQEHGTTSTRELVELSVGLLSGLLYVEAKYREALLDGLLPSDGPLPPPPSSSHIDLTNWFQTLAKYATEQSVRGLARHQQLVERVASGEISPAQMQEQGRRFVEARAPQFVDEVMSLGLEFVGRLQRSSMNVTEGVYDRILGPEAAASTAVDSPVVVDLRGPIQTTVTSTIEVENTRSEIANVVCSVSEFIPRSGGQPFTGRVEVTPARFMLQPGGSHDVQLSVTLDDRVFRADEDYFAILRIAGARDREMLVQVIVHPERSRTE